MRLFYCLDTYAKGIISDLIADETPFAVYVDGECQEFVVDGDNVSINQKGETVPLTNDLVCDIIHAEKDASKKNVG
jgi:hypothetical protein